jgi:hypothetical protein
VRGSEKPSEFSILGPRRPNRLIDYLRNRAISCFRLTAKGPMKITIKIHCSSF